MSGTSASDPFEIIDDASEFIASRHGQPDVLKKKPDPHTDQSLASPATLTGKRSLPPGFSSSTTSLPRVQNPAARLTSSSTSQIPHEYYSATLRKEILPSSLQGTARGRAWNPPPRPWEIEIRDKAASAVAALESRSTSSRDNSAQIALIGGSGARVPNRFLDAKGEFHYTSHQSGAAAIDLTVDGVSDDDDEPQLVSVKNGDVISDEVKNNGPVCLGVVQAVVLCMFGCPEPIAADGPATKDPTKDDDPLWARESWKGASRWFLEPGFRPVLIKLHRTASSASSSPSLLQSTAGQWAYGGNAPKVSQEKAEMTVSVMLSPLAYQLQQANEGVSAARQRFSPHVKEPFGTLSEKFVNALEPLMSRGIVQSEARCRLVERGRAGNFIHPIQMLLFCMRPSVGLVSERLAQAGITLEQPRSGSYFPSDYKGNPPLINPHGSSVLADSIQQLARSNRLQSSHFLGGGQAGAGRFTQSKEMTEEERRKQVESVYDELVSGDDLPLTEPSDLITTSVFPHQKQGLTFLLDREAERHFEGAADVMSKSSRTVDLRTFDDVAKDSVGLWQVVRSSIDDSIRAYRNVLTQHEQTERPEICRGAILADDMGLGKTITVIAVIASSMDDARSFAGSKPLNDPSQVSSGNVAASESEEETTVCDMAQGLQNFSRPVQKKSKKLNGRVQPKKNLQKKMGKREAQRLEAERIRQKQIVTKSRATLIVCPLTIVANWEEQIKEHWDAKRLPKIYVYHGTSRSDDPVWIANHDIVLTTYATLASEFSNQSIWKEALSTPGGEKNDTFGYDGQEDHGDDSSEMEDASGAPLDAQISIEQKKKTKKRKRAVDKEAPNPLQRIDWFRVVLDEAHTIKEVRTMQCRAVCNLTAQRRLSLTGTPVQNRLDDLYAQIRFLRLDPFCDRIVWNEHCGQRQKRGYLSSRFNASTSNEPLEQVALAKVQTIMKFLTLRRTKETRTASGARLLDLPPKNTRVVTIDFDDRERARYQALHERYKDDFKELEATNSVGSNYATILQEISNLRICCDDPGLVDARKDLKRLREGRSNYTTAIREDGLTRERAAGLFEVFSEAAGAECDICGTDLTSFVEDAGIKEELSDDPTKARLRPIVTRCLHVFCSRCFSKQVPEWRELTRSKTKQIKAQERCACPLCEEFLGLLLDVVQLEASDLGTSTGGHSRVTSSALRSPAADNANEGDVDELDWGSDEEAIVVDSDGIKGRARQGFGCDRQIPIEERPALSHKIRFLLNDLIPISMGNPQSFLYDADAPRLLHYVPTESDRAAKGGDALESVVTVPSEAVPGVSNDPKPIKSVVFSQWTSMLDRVERALYRAGIRTARLDGRMRRSERAAAMEMFKRDRRCEVFLISLRAGGFGLNLVSACRAYCLEPAWNPAQEQQAMDRVHRLGQLQPVIATKLVTRDSIETRMLEVQKRKQELANKVAEKRADGGPTREEEKANRREEIRTLIG